MSASRPAELKSRACRRGRTGRFLNGLFGLLAFAGVAASLTPAFAFTRDINIVTVTTWIVGADIGTKQLTKVTGPSPMIITLTPTLPNGVTFDATAFTLTGTPTATFSKTQFTLSVTDGDGDRIRYIFPIEVVADVTPAFAQGTAIVNQSWTASTAISTLQLPAATGGNAPLRYSLTPTLPTGLTFNPTARTITGTPTATLGSTTFTYTATDANGDTATLTFDIEVVADSTPAFAQGAAIVNQSWTASTAISTLQLPAATGGNAPLTYSLTTPLPTGLTFDPTARTVTGTPTAALVKTQFTYTVTDGDGDTATLTFDIEVAADLTPAFAQSTAIVNQSWTASTAISTLQLPAATGGNAPLRYSLTPTLPTGLTFNPTARTITGTPTATLGSTTFTYTATDANGDTATLTFDIEVAADLTPAFAQGTAIDDQSWTAGTAIGTLQLPAATGGNAPLTYSLSPTLPTGVTFDAAARTVTGTPTAVFSKTSFTYTVTDGDDDTATLTFDIEVAAEPRVTSVTFDNSPASGDTYGQGETIRVRVTFNRRVVGARSVGSLSAIELTIGRHARQARWSSGGVNPLDSMFFSYTVQDDDLDADGISIPANAISLNGGTIRAVGIDADLTHDAVAADSARKVDGSATSAPRLTGGISVAEAPRDGATFQRGERILVQAVFDIAVLVTGGPPRVELTIGSNTRYAAYYNPPGSDDPPRTLLWFTYTVQAGDVDADGIDIPANALSLNGGAITAADGTTNADLTSAAWRDRPAVNGSTVTAPRVRRSNPIATASIPENKHTYALGEKIDIGVRFDRHVVVTGTPRLAVTIGTQTRQADYNRYSEASLMLIFRYTVQAGDLDANGIDIPANALSVNGGSISLNGTDAVLDHDAVAPSALRKVDGVVPVVIYTDPTGPWTANQAITAFGPTTTHTDIDSYAVKAGSSLPSGLTLDGTTGEISGTPDTANPNTHATIVVITDKAGNTGETTVTFPAILGDKPAFAQGTAIANQSWTAGTAIGTLQLPEATGGNAPLTYSLTPTLPTGLTFDATARTVTGTPTATLRKTSFTYTVSDGDGDTATLTFDIEVAASVAVDVPAVRYVTFHNSPASGDTYRQGERIEVMAVFDTAVVVTGAPWIELTIGSNKRYAAYYNPPGSDDPPETTLVFLYTVQAGDVDTDGIDIAANAIDLNGGSISTNGAEAELDHDAVAANANRKVDGRTMLAPAVTSLYFDTKPRNRHTYGLGELIGVDVVFSKDVTVTGSPQLGLTIGDRTRQAVYDEGNSDGRTLFFRYDAQVSDRDTDGISIAANAIDLNGGTIMAKADGATAAVLTHRALADDPKRKVDGRTVLVPEVSSISFNNAPQGGDTYGLGEVIEVAVAFNASVTVTGDTQLGLLIGAETKQAVYYAGSGSRKLLFRYTVQEGDRDTDGISVPEDAISPGRGQTIAATANSETPAFLRIHAVAADPDRKVDGNRVAVPAVSSLSFDNRPLDGDTYGFGEEIEVAIAFNVSVMVTGIPKVGLTIGNRTRQAVYDKDKSDGSTLVFFYRVEAGDVDTDGISIAANALALNSGRIWINAGGGIGIDAKLDHDAVAPSALRKVDGVVPVVIYTDPTGTWIANQAITDLEPTTKDTDIASYMVKSGSSLPPGLALDRTTGVISGTPTTANPNTHDTVVVITDKAGNTGETTVTFPVILAEKPAFAQDAAIANQSWIAGTAIGTLQLPEAAGGNAPLTYSLTTPLPTGLTFDPTARTVTGTPTAALVKTQFTYTVTDGDGDTATLTFDIEVAADLTPAFAQGVTIVNQSWIAGTAIGTLQLPEAAGGNAPLTYSLTPTLPDGLTFDATARTITGTPTAAFSKTSFTYTATDGDGDTATLTFDIEVAADLTPAFAQSAAIPAQSWTEGTAISTLQLPGATGGNAPLTYSLTPAVPTGLTFNATARTVTGTPTAALSKTSFTYTVTDADGDPATLTFDIEVISAAMAMRERLRGVNEAVLPELARTMTASTAGAVADRLGAAAPATGETESETLASLARLLEANERALSEGDFSWRRALAGKSFALGLSGDGDDGAGPGSGGVAVWGAGDWRNLSLDGPVDWDGDMFAAHLGVDAALGDGVRAGAAVSRFESSIDYTDNGGETPAKGTHESRMTSVHPYAALSLPDGSRLWALAGYGRGEIEIDDAAAGRQSSDSTLLTAAAGASTRLLSEDATALDLKGEAQGSRLEVDDNGDLVEGLSVRTWRMRLALEGSRDFELFPDTVMTPSLELGLRWDGGDGETGTGVEIGGGLGYVDREKGLTAEVSARALAAPADGVREWGVSGLLRLDPGARGRGLSLSLSPSWGEAGSGMAQLWEDGLTGPAADGDAGAVPAGRIEAELGYGLPAFGGAGLVTPYGGVAFANGGDRLYRVGGRLDLGAGFDLSLEGSRRERADDTPEHGANLTLRMSW